MTMDGSMLYTKVLVLDQIKNLLSEPIFHLKSIRGYNIQYKIRTS
jgi:hypothetical protein